MWSVSRSVVLSPHDGESARSGRAVPLAPRRGLPLAPRRGFCSSRSGGFCSRHGSRASARRGGASARAAAGLLRSVVTTINEFCYQPLDQQLGRASLLLAVTGSRQSRRRDQNHQMRKQIQFVSTPNPEPTTWPRISAPLAVAGPANRDVGQMMVQKQSRCSVNV